MATLKNPGSDTKFAAHHTLLLASTARGAAAVEQSFGQIKFERLVVPADAYDATLRARVAEVVQGQFPDYALIDADATVVPGDLDLRSEEAVRNIIANATTASSTLFPASSSLPTAGPSTTTFARRLSRRNRCILGSLRRSDRTTGPRRRGAGNVGPDRP